MKKEFEAYLTDLELTQKDKERVEEIINFYMNCYADEIKDIFITDIIDTSDKRIFESLYLFTGKSIMEAKRFRSQDDYDYTILVGKIEYWNMKKNRFERNNCDSSSRIYLNFVLTTRYPQQAILKATGNNCDYLYSVFEKYVLKNIS